MSDDDEHDPNIIDLSKVREERETLGDFFTGPQDEEYFEESYLTEEDPIARFNRSFLIDMLSRYRHSMKRMENLQLAMVCLVLIQIVLTATMLFVLPY